MSEQQPPRRLTRKELLRRNKRIAKRRQQRLTVIVVVLTAFMVYITGLYGTSLAYLGDFVSSGMVYLQFGEGFPIKAENQTYKQSEKMGSALCVLDSEKLSFYSPTGGLAHSYYHSMQNPVISASTKRVAIYNANDTSLKIANASNILFSQEMQNDIVHASLARNNFVAATTKSQSYNGEVKVFDSKMQERFSWKSAKAFPIQSFLSDKASYMAVSCISAKDGKAVCEVYIIDIDNEQEKYIFNNGENILLAAEFIKEDSLILFFSNKAVQIDLKEFSQQEVQPQIKEYSYGGKDLLGYDIKNSKIVMALGDYNGTFGTDIAVTDLSLNEKFRVHTDKNITTVMLTSQRIYALSDETVSQYTEEGVFVAEQQVKNNIKNIVDYNGCVAVFSDSIEKIDKAKIKKQS